MSKHWTWIVVAGLLAATSAIAATTPAAPDDSSTAAAASGMSCPNGGQGCRCQGGESQGEHQCPGDGSCGCGRFVDENGDGVCDNRGQGGCGCHHGDEEPPPDNS